MENSKKMPKTHLPNVKTWLPKNEDKVRDSKISESQRKNSFGNNRNFLLKLVRPQLCKSNKCLLNISHLLQLLRPRRVIAAMKIKFLRHSIYTNFFRLLIVIGLFFILILISICICAVFIEQFRPQILAYLVFYLLYIAFRTFSQIKMDVFN